MSLDNLRLKNAPKKKEKLEPQYAKKRVEFDVLCTKCESNLYLHFLLLSVGYEFYKLVQKLEILTFCFTRKGQRTPGL